MKQTAKIYHILLTVIFLALISFSFLNDVFLFYKVPEISKTENRKLASKPLFDINNLDPFPKLYENYFNDQYPFRANLALLNTLICFYVFHQSPLPGTVEIGQHGWLFFDQKESIVYQGTFDLTDRQVSYLVRELHDRAIYFRNKGIQFYIAFPPMKPEIYPEYLPPDFTRSPKGTVTDKIVKAIKEDTLIHYIDLKQALLKAKIHGRLYNLTDNHWNFLGAFYGYSAIINRIRKDFPKINPITRSDIYFRVENHPSGNLANMIGLSKYLRETQYIPVIKNRRAKKITFSNKIPDWAKDIDGYELVKSTGDSTLQKIVIIRDSYTNSMMPFMDEAFNTTTYIFDGWKYRKNDMIIDEIKPDIVMLIIFEPHVSHVIGIP